MTIFLCMSFSSCESVLEFIDNILFAEIELIAEPTLTVIQEEDGEYTAIVEGFAKNVSGRVAMRSEAVARYYDLDGNEIVRDGYRFVVDVDRIGEGEVWRFYIKTKNLPAEPIMVYVYVFEDL